MLPFARSRVLLISCGATAGLIVTATALAANRTEAPSLADYIATICSAAFRSAPPEEARFLSENVGAIPRWSRCAAPLPGHRIGVVDEPGQPRPNTGSLGQPSFSSGIASRDWRWREAPSQATEAEDLPLSSPFAIKTHLKFYRGFAALQLCCLGLCNPRSRRRSLFKNIADRAQHRSR